jgi:hypothetical protein
MDDSSDFCGMAPGRAKLLWLNKKIQPTDFIAVLAFSIIEINSSFGTINNI